MYVRIYINVRMSVCEYIYMCVYIYIYIYIYAYACVCVHVCVNLYVYIYMYICVCIYIYVCVCVCERGMTWNHKIYMLFIIPQLNIFSALFLKCLLCFPASKINNKYLKKIIEVVHFFVGPINF